jgi:hypothetical protein
MKGVDMKNFWLYWLGIHSEQSYLPVASRLSEET